LLIDVRPDLVRRSLGAQEMSWGAIWERMEFIGCSIWSKNILVPGAWLEHRWVGCDFVELIWVANLEESESLDNFLCRIEERLVGIRGVY
jgi:hypothetical protein